MKWFFRMFFKTLRIVMTPFMLLWEKATTPKGMVRPAGAQQLVDQQCQNLALYQFRTCPFCIKVRRELSRLSLDVALLDAQKLPQHREALLQGGGRIKVPCLKITDEQGNSQWMYESSAINHPVSAWAFCLTFLRLIGLPGCYYPQPFRPDTA